MAHPELPIHPRFGQAIGLRRNGQPIWSIRGASPEGDPPVATIVDPASSPLVIPAPPAPADEPLGDGGKKALEEERRLRADAEKRAKENAGAAKELAQIKDAQKTESERTAERIAGLEKDAKKALSYEAAAATQLPLSLASRLNGSSLEELIADAAQLKELMGGAPPDAPVTPPPPATPKPDRRQGGGEATTGGSLAAGKALYASRKPTTRQ